MNVQQQTVGGRLPAQFLARLLQRPSEAHGVPELLEVRAKYQPDMGLVIHYQEVPRRRSHQRGAP
jgi:hypothetical protein